MKSLSQYIDEALNEAINNSDTGVFKMEYKDFCMQMATYLKDTIEKTNEDGKKYTDIDLDKFIKDFYKFKLMFIEHGRVSESDLYNFYKENKRMDVEVKKSLSGREKKYAYSVKNANGSDNDFDFYFDSDENIPFE